MKALEGLSPVSRLHTTDIEGVALPIHEFTGDTWWQVVSPLRQMENRDPEAIILETKNVVIKGMEGADYEPTDEDRERLQRILPNGVIREYLHRLNQLNDFGMNVMQAAEKKFAAALSTDTSSNSASD